MFFRSLVSLYVLSFPPSLLFVWRGGKLKPGLCTRQVSIVPPNYIPSPYFEREYVCVCVCMSVCEPRAFNTCRRQKMMWKTPGNQSYCELLSRCRCTHCSVISLDPRLNSWFSDRHAPSQPQTLYTQPFFMKSFLILSRVSSITGLMSYSAWIIPQSNQGMNCLLIYCGGPIYSHFPSGYS